MSDEPKQDDLQRILSVLAGIQTEVEQKQLPQITERELQAIQDAGASMVSLGGKMEKALTLLQRHDQTLTGNGSPEKGHVVRLDRVETSLASLSRLMWLLGAGVTAALVKASFDLLGG